MACDFDDNLLLMKLQMLVHQSRRFPANQERVSTVSLQNTWHYFEMRSKRNPSLSSKDLYDQSEMFFVHQDRKASEKQTENNFLNQTESEKWETSEEGHLLIKCSARSRDGLIFHH
jgi:hypothetical protein